LPVLDPIRAEAPKPSPAAMDAVSGFRLLLFCTADHAHSSITIERTLRMIYTLAYFTVAVTYVGVGHDKKFVQQLNLLFQ
jgi:hypothetical protein